MESYLFESARDADRAVLIEGRHTPGSLTRAGGAWVCAAGRIVLDAGRYPLRPRDQWVWLAVEDGEATLLRRDGALTLQSYEMCVLPAGDAAALAASSQARCLWFALEGPLAPEVVRRLGALETAPLKQQALPGELVLAERIVQATARQAETDDASYLLAHLLYGMLAAHWGQPVVRDAALSPEIVRVVDALRAARYRDNLSLAEMARVAQMPKETFRKRFVSEMGLPPLSYALHCKMERAKELLREPGSTVYQVASEVGIHDPYRFSKQFKSIVGLSPSEFMKRAAQS